MQRTIDLPEPLAKRRDRYLQQHPDEIPSSLLDEILQQKDRELDDKLRVLRIQPAS